MSLALALVVMGAAPATDGRHDFDFEIGTWKMLPSGNTHIVERLWDGATIGRLVIAKPAPHVRGSLLSVYHPDSGKWSIYWVSAADGSVSPPLVGRFSGGVGTFVGPDVEDGKPVLVQLLYTNVTSTHFTTTQSVSHDGGKTWKLENTTSYQRSLRAI